MVLEEAARGDAHDHLAGRGVAPARRDRRRAPALALGQREHGQHRAVVRARQAVDRDAEHADALGTSTWSIVTGGARCPCHVGGGPRRRPRPHRGSRGRRGCAARRWSSVELKSPASSCTGPRGGAGRQRAQVAAPAREVAAVAAGTATWTLISRTGAAPGTSTRRPPSPTSRRGTAAAGAASSRVYMPEPPARPGSAMRCGSSSPRPARSRPSDQRAGSAPASRARRRRSRRTSSTSACGRDASPARVAVEAQLRRLARLAVAPRRTCNGAAVRRARAAAARPRRLDVRSATQQLARTPRGESDAASSSQSAHATAADDRTAARRSLSRGRRPRPPTGRARNAGQAARSGHPRLAVARRHAPSTPRTPGEVPRDRRSRGTRHGARIRALVLTRRCTASAERPPDGCVRDLFAEQRRELEEVVAREDLSPSRRSSSSGPRRRRAAR